VSAGNIPRDGDDVTFAELVAVATLGVSRKGFKVTELDGLAGDHAAVLDAGDPAAALLDAAALLTVAGRAGVQPDPGVRPHEDAALHENAERELSARAVRLLRRIGRADHERGFAAADTDLITDLLTAARDAGYVAAAPILPDLLDAAVRKETLRPVVAAVLGARGRWLAGHRPDWRQAVAETGGAEPPEPEPAGDAAEQAPAIWRTGGQQERLRFLIGLRGRDPQAARRLLAADWERETADDRATLLRVLAPGLSGADEEFLEAALEDRAGRVREVARALLARLPGSGYSHRATERAAVVLRLARPAGPPVTTGGTSTAGGQGGTRVLVVSLPGTVDAAGARDGLSDRPPAPGIGGAAWLLTQVIAAAPLASWTERFGLTPAEIVALPLVTGTIDGTLPIDSDPLAGELALAVRAGWRLATVRQRYTVSAGTTTDRGTTTGGDATTDRGTTADGDATTTGGDATTTGGDTTTTGGGASTAGGTTTRGGASAAGGGTLAGEWALALLAADPPYAGAGRPPSAWPPAESLAALLPPQARATRLAGILADTPVGDVRGTYAVAAEVAAFPVPWPGVLADAVIGVLARSVTRRDLAPLPRAVLGPAARGLPAVGDRDYAAELTALANAVPQDWSPMLHTTAQTIALRRAFLTELR
jgi:hypothetical protein